jgi:hypothetical protein
LERAAILCVGVLAAVALLHGGIVGAGEPPEAPPPPPTLRGSGPAPAEPARPAGDALAWLLLATYEYEPGLRGLPQEIAALDGRRVTMRGFAMPLTEWGEDAREFALVRTHLSCCFGIPPGLSGQVLVRLRGERGVPWTNEPVEVTGTFRAAEERLEGHLLSIFAIEGAEARIVGY